MTNAQGRRGGGGRVGRGGRRGAMSGQRGSLTQPQQAAMENLAATSRVGQVMMG